MKAPRHTEHSRFSITDRAGIAGKDPGLYGPKANRGSNDLLSYGQLDVSIPRNHKLLNIESPSLWRLEFTEDPEKHFVILQRRPETRDSFHTDVNAFLSRADDHDVLLFIHGFNVTFEAAPYRTAQLAYDLGFGGVPMMYSWPSNGQVLQYVADSNSNEWTVRI